jgi:uncharacterized circularly permuted ATP-grasp superfamily protein
MQTAPHTSGIDYDVPDGAWDESFRDDGAARPHYEALLAALADADLEGIDAGVRHDLRSRGAAFRGAGGDQEFRVDIVPRLIESEEWADVERGIAQRLRALNAFLVDVYADQQIVHDGLVPKRVVTSAVHYEPDMHGVPVPRGVAANAAGLDLVRCEDGRLHVLEDNLRTPSGYTYLMAARDVLDERLPDAASHIDRESVIDTVEALGRALRAAAPEGVDDPQLALLSDGPQNSAWWEHELIAHELVIPVVALEDLSFRGGRMYARVDDDERPLDVLYRRTDEDRLRDDYGRPTRIAEVLLEPMRAGAVTVFNAFGAGVADDKLTHAYVEEMIRYYLREEPVLPSVTTFDLDDPGMLARALDEVDDLVFKERSGEGGYGVTIFAHATDADQQALIGELRRRPQDFIAQRRVTLSTHPTLVDGRLVPRHVDLRPFALQGGDEVHVIPGGLTRVAFAEGALVVNSSQNGGGKDTWVLR